MSDATLRAVIKERLEALGPGIGRVHDYERWTANPGQYLGLFQDAATKKVFGWEIVRTGFRTSKITMSKFKLVHRYLLRGYYGLEDSAATEKAVNALVDQIVLDLLRSPLAGSEREQLPEGTIETRMFGAVLCHVVEIRLPEVAEIVQQLPEPGETDLLRVGLEYYLQDPADDGVADAADLVELQ